MNNTMPNEALFMDTLPKVNKITEAIASTISFTEFLSYIYFEIRGWDGMIIKSRYIERIDAREIIYKRSSKIFCVLIGYSNNKKRLHYANKRLKKYPRGVWLAEYNDYSLRKSIVTNLHELQWVQPEMVPKIPRVLTRITEIADRRLSEYDSIINWYWMEE